MSGFPRRATIGPVRIAPATVLAPMAGVTDTVFRRLIRNQGGCGLIMTEFTSSHGVVATRKRAGRKPTRTFRYLYFEPEEHPISAQLFGSDPQVMADAAKACQDFGFDIVDINFGCPVKKVVKCNGGSGLLRDLPLVEEILRKVRAAISIPFTMKFRAGWNDRGIGGRANGQARRGLRTAGRRPASAHARAGLQRQGGLDAHRGSEGRREDSGDRQRRHRDARGCGPHGRAKRAATRS
jgi:tRNA-dihydrouridine synthase